jgi:rhodanese-related sulfurtransferase
MRNNTYILLAAILVSLFALAGCNSAESKTAKSTRESKPTSPTAASPSYDAVNRISVAEAHEAFKNGKAIFVDVRTEPAYKAGHIKGAVLIPLNEITARAGELPKDKTIILYCSCPAEQSSLSAAQQLQSKEIRNTAALVGGFPAWKAAGHPVE